jgi:ATP-binding cassette subfamily F protein 3
LLSLDKISLTFGDRNLFDEVSTLINPGERVGLVGPNGAGKSTLLKVIAGEMEPDGGNITTSKTATIGYLPQDGVAADSSLSLIEEMASAFDGLQDLEQKVHEARNELAGSDEQSDGYE